MLSNKLDLSDQDELDEAELALFLIRADEDQAAGRLDYPHYMTLHHHLCQDLYEWAGQARTIWIGKGENWFCYPEYIDQEVRRAFAALDGHHF